MSGNMDQRPHVAYQSTEYQPTAYHGAAEPLHKSEIATVGEQEVPESSANSLKKEEVWRPGWRHQFPYSGFGALVGVMLMTSLCVMIVYLSDGKAKSQWKPLAAPNVLVSLCTSISSILIAMAVGNGIAISWWRKAMKGTTVEELHTSWSFGSSITAIIFGLKFFNVMALAALCTKLAIIDGILFQKALTTTELLGLPKNATIERYTFPNWPVTGLLNQYGNDTAEQTFAMTYDMSYWLQSNLYAGIDWTEFFVGDQLEGCEGLCGLTYRGVGFSSSCVMPTNMTYVSRNRTAVQAGNNTLLDIEFSLQNPTATKNYSYVQLDWWAWLSYSINATNNPRCLGSYQHLQCELRPALVDYPIVIQNTSFSGRSKKGSKESTYNIRLGTVNQTDGSYIPSSAMNNYGTDTQLSNFSIVSYIDINDPAVPNGNSSLGGIVSALNTYYKSSSVATYVRLNSTKATNGTYTPINTNSGLQIAFTQLQNLHDNCPTGFTLPGNDGYDDQAINYDTMLAGIDQLMLLIAQDPYIQTDYPGQWGDFNADDNTTYNNWLAYVNQYTNNATMVAMKPEIYYYSKVAFAWGAFASTIVIVFLILPSYWGYWELGRKVTLGPLEIASAFDAPAFSHVNRGTGHVDHVLAAVGTTRVKYDTNGKYGFVHH